MGSTLTQPLVKDRQRAASISEQTHHGAVRMDWRHQIRLEQWLNRYICRLELWGVNRYKLVHVRTHLAGTPPAQRRLDLILHNIVRTLDFDGLPFVGVVSEGLIARGGRGLRLGLAMPATWAESSFNSFSSFSISSALIRPAFEPEDG